MQLPWANRQAWMCGLTSLQKTSIQQFSTCRSLNSKSPLITPSNSLSLIPSFSPPLDSQSPPPDSQHHFPPDSQHHSPPDSQPPPPPGLPASSPRPPDSQQQAQSQQGNSSSLDYRHCHLETNIFKEFAAGPDCMCSSCSKACCYPDQGSRSRLISNLSGGTVSEA